MQINKEEEVRFIGYFAWKIFMIGANMTVNATL